MTPEERVKKLYDNSPGVHAKHAIGIYSDYIAEAIREAQAEALEEAAQIVLRVGCAFSIDYRTNPTVTEANELLREQNKIISNAIRARKQEILGGKNE